MALSVPQSPGQTLIALMCGLPASGKSTIVRQLCTRFAGSGVRCEPIIFDRVLGGELDGAPWSPDAWKAARCTLMKACVDVVQKRSADRLLVMVEDNFHLRSMRREYFKVARACEYSRHNRQQFLGGHDRSLPKCALAGRVGFMEIELRCSAAECIARNCRRVKLGDADTHGASPGHTTGSDLPTAVTAETILRMASHFEPIGVEPWERRGANVVLTDGRAVEAVVDDIATLLNQVAAWDTSLVPPSLDSALCTSSTKEDTEDGCGGAERLQSDIHVADLRLRALVQRTVTRGEPLLLRLPVLVSDHERLSAGTATLCR